MTKLAMHEVKSVELLEETVRQWSQRPAPPEVAALARAARERHDGVEAVLFYGSCQRNGRADEGIADLYLLVEDYRRAFGSRFKALLNRLLPPNVFYLELPWEGKVLRAKYAVLTMEQFDRGARGWFHSYIWGRFAQPAGIVYSRDGEKRARVLETLTGAVETFVARALPQAPETFTVRELWCAGLSLSYRCELRTEDPAATSRLFDATPEYYRGVTEGAMLASALPFREVAGAGETRYRLEISPRQRKLNLLCWRLRSMQGKVLSALRLVKALLTFENGIDYIYWKIERHTGVKVESSPALRRFPPLAVLVTFWRLFRRGGFR